MFDQSVGPNMMIPMSVDELSMVLTCMAEVNLTDVKDRQVQLERRLARTLRKKAPDHYAALVALAKIDDIAAA